MNQEIEMNEDSSTYRYRVDERLSPLISGSRLELFRSA